MKVKCPFCQYGGFNVVPDRHGEPEQEPCPNCNMVGYLDVELPTPDLIAELEKRALTEKEREAIRRICENKMDAD